jgi:hypothetical protein
MLRFWYGGRYPIALNASYYRHGANIYDAEGNLVENVGGDPFQTRRPEDPMTVDFLDGRLTEVFSIGLSAGYEIVRGFNVYGRAEFANIDGLPFISGRILFRYGDF